jgi:hypothetical protein
VTEDEPTEDDLQNPTHWRARAEETREKANAMDSSELRERMLQIATEYDRLAEVVERASAPRDAPRDAPAARRMPNGRDSF